MLVFKQLFTIFKACCSISEITRKAMFFLNIQDRLLESKHEVGEKRWLTMTKSVQNPVIKTSRNKCFFNPVSNLGNREWLTKRPTKCQQSEERKNSYNFAEIFFLCMKSLDEKIQSKTKQINNFCGWVVW